MIYGDFSAFYNPVLMVFKRPTVTMENHVIEFTEEHKSLGIAINKKLNWLGHINHVRKSFNAKVKKLHRIRTLNCETLSTFYYSTIISSVCYGISVWYNCFFDKFSNLEKIHAKAARVIYHLPAKYSDHKCLEHVNWYPLSYIYKRRLLCLMHSIYYGEMDVCILNNFKKPSTRISSRNQLKLEMSVIKRETDQNRFSYQGITLWNTMPDELKSVINYAEFKAKLFSFSEKIMNYSFTLNTSNIHSDFIFNL